MGLSRRSIQIVAFLGSPREGGNCDLLVEQILDGVRSKSKSAMTEKVNLNQLKISPCQACFEYDTPQEGKCKVNDDMAELYEKLEYADGIIIATPIYFGGVSAQLKAFIDRWYCRYGWDFRNRLAPGKCGVTVLTWADPRNKILNVHYFVADILKALMQQLGIEVVGELTVRGIGKKGEVLNFPDVMKRAFDLGVELIQALEMPLKPKG